MDDGWILGCLGGRMVGCVGDQSEGWKDGDLWMNGRMISILMMEGWEVVVRSDGRMWGWVSG